PLHPLASFQSSTSQCAAGVETYSRATLCFGWDAALSEGFLAALPPYEKTVATSWLDASPTNGATMTHNPIYPGYIWRQAFDFPEGFFEAGDVVRAEFRRFAKDPAPLAAIEGGLGAVIEDNRLFVELSEEQTSAIAR